MANLREIRSRINGVRNTSKITQAMKLVAAAKLRRAQEAILAARPYAYSLRDMLSQLLAKADRSTMPLTMDRNGNGAVLLIVVTADRGLCGAFNTNIIKTTSQRIHTHWKDVYEQGKLSLLCIGRRGYVHFSKRGYPILQQHVGLVNTAGYEDAETIMNKTVRDYLDGRFDIVEVIYNEFKSVVHQKIVQETLLPLPVDEDCQTEKYHEFVDYIYEPSEHELLEQLIPRHLNFQLFRILLESNASEQGARMTAMDSATSNAHELIHDLQLQYNSARQASITTELIEIVSGANALQNA